MRLEPLEFQQCLVSLGYDVKEKVCMAYVKHVIGNVEIVFLAAVSSLR